MASPEELVERGFVYYKNSAEVGALGGMGITVTDLALASLFAKLNILLVSGPGYGKTQLANDIASGIFGGKSLSFRGSQEINLESVLLTLDLNKLKEVSNPQDAITLTEKIKYNMFYVDEIKRCPELVQNVFFSLFDGYAEHPTKAEKLPLGGDYHIGLASANSIEVSKRYSGEFSMDDALLERMHVVINLNYYHRNVADLYDADDVCPNEPRIKFADNEDLSGFIIETHKQLSGLGVTLEELIFKDYLEFGLDYIEGDEFSDVDNSKRKLDSDFPQAVLDLGQNADKLNFVKPFSPRTTSAVVGLARGLKKVAELKGADPNELDCLQLALELILPYSGSLTEPIFNMSKRKNPILVAKPIIEQISSDYRERIHTKRKKIRSAVDGNLTSRDLEEFKDKSRFLKDIVKKIYSNRRQLADAEKSAAAQVRR